MPDTSCDENDSTPLMWAAELGRVITMRTLIDAKASLKTRNTARTLHFAFALPFN